MVYIKGIGLSVKQTIKLLEETEEYFHGIREDIQSSKYKTTKPKCILFHKNKKNFFTAGIA